MKKILFLFAFFFLLSPLSALAQTVFTSEAACQQAGGGGGVCLETGIFIDDDACTENLETLGTCRYPNSFGVTTDSACCKLKDEATDSGDATQKIFTSEAACQQAGGGSGSCNRTSDSCSSDEQILGSCKWSGWTDNESACCAPKGSVPEQNNSATGETTSLEYSDYKLLEQIPGSTNTSGKLQPYLESIYKAGLVLIVMGSVFMISIGGFLYMSSAGNTSMIKKGKGMITDAIIGLVVALLIWLLLNIINPDLVNLKIDPLEDISFDPGNTGAVTAGQNSDSESNLSAQEAAKKILEHKNITMLDHAGDNCPGADAGAKSNLQQVAAGQGMVRCPCGGGGTVAAHAPMLNALVALADSGKKFRINYIAGACHSANSWHYKGRAVDMKPDNGSDRVAAVSFFKLRGATETFCDLKGKSVSCGLATHVHAAWE